MFVVYHYVSHQQLELATVILNKIFHVIPSTVDHNVSLLSLTCLCLQDEETGLALLVDNVLAAVSRPVSAVGGIDFA